MGRPPLDQETRREVTIRLIQITQEMILHDGLEAVTIRKIANRAGVNSAVLYRYFQDLDELLLFGCVDIFKAYCYDLLQSETDRRITGPEKAYMISWDLFCQYAFQYPECINHLFFSKHSGGLGHVIESYYALFPEQLEGISNGLQDMLRSTNLYKRNLEILRPLLQQHVSEDRMQLINDLTVSYFRKLLSDKMAGGEAVDDDLLRAQMLNACQLLLVMAQEK